MVYIAIPPLHWSNLIVASPRSVILSAFGWPAWILDSQQQTYFISPMRLMLVDFTRLVRLLYTTVVLSGVDGIPDVSAIA